MADSLGEDLLHEPNMKTHFNIVAIFFLLLGICGIQLEGKSANPFLPSYEYIPDGEPKVFGDRVYLYGSHDRAGSTKFCDYILKVWSAPLSDLNRWTDHGISFSTRTVDGHTDDVPWSDNELYAPDVVEKGGKYYLYATIVGSPCAVAVSDTPAGPFKLISRIQAPTGSPIDFGVWGQYFDAGVLVDDDSKVYLYWGGGKSFMAQLNPANMTEILPNTYQENIIPQEEPFQYQEGPSPRKINGIYYLIFAAGGNLNYATSQSPTGPFAFGGTIVRQAWDNPGGNIHGSLAKLNGQWHIFYHRMTNNTVFSRRACVERVSLESDGKIRSVEQTSLGFQTALDPYVLTSADIACVLKGGNYVTELGRQIHPVINNKAGSVVGYRYFDFGLSKAGQQTSFGVDLRAGECSGYMEIWLDAYSGLGERIGTVRIEKPQGTGTTWRRFTIPTTNISGRHAVYFKFESNIPNTNIGDVRSFVFTRKMQRKEFP